MNRKLFLSAAAALALLVSPAKAEIIASATSFGGTNGISYISGPLLIWFNQPALPFVTTRPGQRVEITFSADCSTNWTVDVTLLVDGQATYPDDHSISNGISRGSSFCVADAFGNARGGLVTKIGLINVPQKGRHFLTVRADVNPGFWYIMSRFVVTVER